MKKIILVFALASLFLLSSCGKKNENIDNGESTSNTQEVKDPSLAELSFEDFSFNTMTLEGEKLASEDYFSQSALTMVNVWGTFCPPCIHEMPDLAKLHQDYEESEFQILGLIIDTTVNAATNVEEAEEIVKSSNVTYTNILVSPSLEEYLSNFQAVPTTFFVDAQGNVVGNAYKGAKSYDQWKAIIDETLTQVQS
ncbi:MAG: TlpA family protein disulfide reductase [Tissierellia bacterium]|nr:TlpA family protein disulfide reductase [Tissierellia bacterium]